MVGGASVPPAPWQVAAAREAARLCATAAKQEARRLAAEREARWRWMTRRNITMAEILGGRNGRLAARPERCGAQAALDSGLRAGACACAHIITGWGQSEHHSLWGPSRVPSDVPNQNPIQATPSSQAHPSHGRCGLRSHLDRRRPRPRRVGKSRGQLLAAGAQDASSPAGPLSDAGRRPQASELTSELIVNSHEHQLGRRAQRHRHTRSRVRGPLGCGGKNKQTSLGHHIVRMCCPACIGESQCVGALARSLIVAPTA